MKKILKYFLFVLLLSLLLAPLLPCTRAADIGAAVELTAATVSDTTNSYATIAYTEGISQPAASLLRPYAISWQCPGLGATNWLSVAKDGVTWHSSPPAADTAAAGVSFITNEWYIKRGDTVSIRSEVTNAVSVTIHALER